ncbi:hypothetical protein [Flaviaesturariibacter terrae]
METRSHIALELKEAGLTLPAGLHVPPYAVPEGYFDSFAALVLARIRREEAAAELEESFPLLAGIPKEMPFAVPEGYFERTAVLPSLLDSIGREMPYAVPAGYFESLPQVLLARVAPPAAKVVRMRPRWVQLAAAAVVGAVLVVGGWLYEGGHSTVTSNPEAWVEKGLKSVPDETLDEFIETTDPAASVAAGNSARKDVSTLLKDMPVSEMDAFLDQVPVDDMTNAN